jgi:hypothetical protein
MIRRLPIAGILTVASGRTSLYWIALLDAANAY